MFSIVTPTYNREDLVQTTIKSIQAQTYTNWELIIVDDGSTDNTEEVLKPYLEDKRIQYIKKKNTGQAHSLNTGVGYAKGEFIVFLDSDDEAYNNWLEVASKNIKEDTGILCVGAIRKFADGTVIQEGLTQYTFYNETQKLKFTCGSLFMRRNIFLELGGYDAGMRSNIQTDLGYRLINYFRSSPLKAVGVEEYLVQINIHNGERIRTNWQKRTEGGIQFLNKHYKFIYDNNKKEIANLCSTIAFSNYKLKKRKQSVKYLIKAIKHNPLRGINYIRVFKYAFM